MTFYDVLCQWNKETEIVIKCRKLSLSQIVVTIFFPVPFPPSPFGFRRLKPPRQEFYTPPPLKTFIHPQPLEGSFQGWGVGVYKLWPRYTAHCQLRAKPTAISGTIVEMPIRRAACRRAKPGRFGSLLGCRKWGCNRWGLKGLSGPYRAMRAAMRCER